MSGDSTNTAPGGDIRLRGFPSRTSLEEAIAWVRTHAKIREPEEVSIEEAAGRVLATSIQAPADIPPVHSAITDGYAVFSKDTVGASSYNPLTLTIASGAAPWQPNTAALIAAGTPLPPGADAVLAFEAAERSETTLAVFGVVAAGTGICRQGQQVRAGASFELPRLLRPQDVGLLAALGMKRVSVVRKPRVWLFVAGPKPESARLAGDDCNTPMLRALITRDGGLVEGVHPLTLSPEAANQAAGLVDAILFVGRTGTGPDDEAPLTLAAAGEVAIHGVAIRPGGSAGMGWVLSCRSNSRDDGGSVGRIPAFLLPGDPLACLCAYDFLAGALIRREGGRDWRLPYAIREAEVGRKIVSAVGQVDVCRVQLREGKAEPVGSLEAGGLVSTVRADGFVVVPAPLEGYPPGARVAVYVYDENVGSTQEKTSSPQMTPNTRRYAEEEQK